MRPHLQNNEAPPLDHVDFHRHMYRELNTEADARANLGRKSGRSYWCAPLNCAPECMRLYSDRSFKDGQCGEGWVAYGANDPGLNDDAWTIFAWMCFSVEGHSITCAEVEAYAAAQALVATCLTVPRNMSAMLSMQLHLHMHLQRARVNPPPACGRVMVLPGLLASSVFGTNCFG